MSDMQARSVWDELTYIPTMDGIWDDDLSSEELNEILGYVEGYLDIEVC